MNVARSILQERRARLAAGALALFFYVVRVGVYQGQGTLEHGLWSCHLASVAVGLGLLLRSATLNAIGFLWVTVGIPVWLLDLATGGRFWFSSVLTHFGAFVLGSFGIWTLGLPAASWWKALLGLAGLNALTRWVTSPSGNVNLAFAVWRGWEAWFPSHHVYLGVLGALAALIFFGVTTFLRRIGFAKPGRGGEGGGRRLSHPLALESVD